MKYFALFLALALTACASQTPQKTVFEIRSAYDAAVLVPLTHYRTLPTCPVQAPICKEPDVVTALLKADGAALAALDAAETVVRNNPKIDAKFAIAAAQNAVSAATVIITLYGVK